MLLEYSNQATVTFQWAHYFAYRALAAGRPACSRIPHVSSTTRFQRRKHTIIVMEEWYVKICLIGYQNCHAKT